MAKAKSLLAGSQRVVLLLCLLALGSQCTQQAVEKKADGPCLIKQVDETSVNSGAGIETMTNTRGITYTYNAAGLPIQVMEHYTQQTPKQGIITDYTTENTYAYDAAAYLTDAQFTARYKTQNDAGSWGSRTTNSYTDGRLSEQITRSLSATGITADDMKTYAYDASGALVRIVQRTVYQNVPDSLKEKAPYADKSESIWTYQNGRATDYVVRTNGVDTRPYILQNGLVQRTTQGDRQYSDTYDAQDRLAKREVRVNGVLESTEERSYSAAKSATSTWPAFKGVPAYAGSGCTSCELASLSYRKLLSNGGYFTTTMTAQVKTNGAGFVQSVDEIDTHTNYDSRGSSYQIRTSRTYTYDGTCN